MIKSVFIVQKIIFSQQVNVNPLIMIYWSIMMPNPYMLKNHINILWFRDPLWNL